MAIPNGQFKLSISNEDFLYFTELELDQLHPESRQKAIHHQEMVVLECQDLGGVSFLLSFDCMLQLK